MGSQHNIWGLACGLEGSSSPAGWKQELRAFVLSENVKWRKGEHSDTMLKCITCAATLESSSLYWWWPSIQLILESICELWMRIWKVCNCVLYNWDIRLCNERLVSWRRQEIEKMSTQHYVVWGGCWKSERLFGDLWIACDGPGQWFQDHGNMPSTICVPTSD